MSSNVEQHKERFEKVIDHLHSEISTLRTGRATPALVEDIIVEAYGVKQEMKTLASISVANAKTLTVDPWDKSLLQEVENAIRHSDLGINPVNDGKLIRLPLPDLTTERRTELIKVLHKKLEEARIAVRKIREDVKNSIEKAMKDKAISEDEKFTEQDELDGVVKEFNERIKGIGEEKEVDIAKV